MTCTERFWVGRAFRPGLSVSLLSENCHCILYAKKPQQFSISLRSLLGFEERRSGCWSSRKTHPKGMVFLMLWKICKNPEIKTPGKIYRPVGSPHFCPLDVPKKNTWNPSIEESLTENGYPLRNRREASVMAAVPSRPKAVQIVTSSSFVPPISQISCKKSGLWSSESRKLESPWIANAGTAATDIVPLSYGDTTTLGFNFDLDIQASKRHQEIYKFIFREIQQMFSSQTQKTNQKALEHWQMLLDYRLFSDQDMRQDLVVRPSNQGRINGAESVRFPHWFRRHVIPHLLTKKIQVHQPLGLSKRE